MSTVKRNHTGPLAKDLHKILRFQKQRNWEQFQSPKNLAISLSLESSEVLELFQWSANNSLPANLDKKLSNELADVYYYLLLLAHTANIDLHKAFASKMITNARKYPVHDSTSYASLSSPSGPAGPIRLALASGAEQPRSWPSHIHRSSSAVTEAGQGIRTNASIHN